MEIADNQHPIDLSQKCRYYNESPPFMKSSVSSSRPLPGLIPISLLHETPSSPFECFRSCKQSLLDFSFKDQSRERKEASRFRTSTAQHPTHSSKMRKSKSETRIPPFPSAQTEHPFGRTSNSNPFNVPMHRNAAITRSDGIRKYNAEREKNYNFVSTIPIFSMVTVAGGRLKPLGQC